MNDEWKEAARILVTDFQIGRFGEDAQVSAFAGALQAAYKQGRTDMKEQCMIVVDTCVIRDPTLHKLNQCFAELE